MTLSNDLSILEAHKVQDPENHINSADDRTVPCAGPLAAGNSDKQNTAKAER